MNGKRAKRLRKLSRELIERRKRVESIGEKQAQQYDDFLYRRLKRQWTRNSAEVIRMRLDVARGAVPPFPSFNHFSKVVSGTRSNRRKLYGILKAKAGRNGE